MVVGECLKDGSWSIDTAFATCEKITCPHPGLVNGARIVYIDQLLNQTGIVSHTHWHA